VFRVFLYASRTSKIQRLIAVGTSEEKAITDVDTIDRDRAAFVKRYFKLNWPERQIYNAMFNTGMGDSYVAEMLAYCARQIASHEQISTITNSE
jgi:Cytidylate kinase-like family